MAAVEPPATPPGPGGPVTCPWCGSDRVELVGEVGPTPATSQWICNACASPFERIRRRGRPRADDG
jgi:ring-1,2-phenylacetyl-CoA epoxidase subunit PaaD